MTALINFLKDKTARPSLRTSIMLICLGVMLETLIAVSALVITQVLIPNNKSLISSDWRQPLILGNSVVGMFSSLILTYGIFSYIRGFRVQKNTLVWVFVSMALLMSFKAFDVLQTFYDAPIQNMLGLNFTIDQMVVNILIVAIAATLLVGVMYAFYDMHRLSEALLHQNYLLEAEVKMRERLVRQLSTNEEKLSIFLNTISSPLFLVDREGVVIAHNSGFAKLFGEGKTNLVGSHLRDLMSTHVFETGKSHATSVFETGQSSHFVLYLNTRAFDVNTYPVKDASGEIYCLTILAMDITEALRKDEERLLLVTAINQAAECIMITDKEGRIEYVNPAFEKMTGYMRHEVMGRNPSLLKSGKQNSSFYQELWKTILAGQVWRGRFINRHKNGTLFYEDATISPVAGPEGDITHFVSVKRNVTREVQLEQQLQQAQKLDALGTLAGGIAHDLNNVLAIIMGHTELTIEMLGEAHPAQESLYIILNTAIRSSQLVRRLLSFVRMSPGEISPLTIGPLIKEQMKVVRSFIPTNVEIREAIRLDQEVILADAGDIQQIIVNLLNNANLAMQPNGGVLTVQAQPCTIDPPQDLSTGTLQPGRYLQLSVTDTGCGMDESVRMRAFEPFFTTRGVGEGTGLGLAMIHRTVIQAGGQIMLTSEPGQGTQVDIYWPLIEPEVSKRHVPQRERTSGKGISVMIIDDLLDFLDLLSQNLQNRGFTVSTFSEAQSALDFFRTHIESIDVVVVDYMMPKMNGKQLAEALHELRPDLPVVLLTGYASTITAENAAEHGFSGVFEKPLEISLLSDHLIQIVR